MSPLSPAAVLPLTRAAAGHAHGPESTDGLAATLAAYRHLARRGELTPEQLALALDVPPAQARAIIAELAGFRLVRQTDGGTAFAVPLSQSVDDLLDEQALHLTQVVQRIDEGRRKLRTLIDNRSLLDPLEASRVTSTVLGDGEPHGMFELPGEARDAVCALHPGGTFDDDLLHRSLARAGQALERGVRMRVVHQPSVLRHPSTVAYLAELSAMGGRVRLRHNLPFRLLLIDGSTAVCSVPGSGSYLLRGERVMVLLNRIFETAWVDAEPLDRARSGEAPAPSASRSAPPAQRPATLTAVHEGILKLLAEGQTDGSIARAAGITTRTVRRRINEIYESLGVESRFQAGVAAKELGIV